MWPMEMKTMEINGRSIEYEQKNLDIHEVDYYLDNPRINYIISKYPRDRVTPKLIEEALLLLDSTKELEQDIFENKGLLDAIIVYDNKVIEGNTRLCCYRRLYQRTQDPRWKKIKSNIIINPLSTDEIFALLSNYHLKGKKQWDLYEKAAYIDKMVNQEGKPIEEIARIVRSTKPKVENMLKAYQVMRDKYLKKREANVTNNEIRDELRRFSYFEAFYTNKHLSEISSKTPEFINEFVEWVYEDRIPKAADVRELHNILENKKANRAFLENEPSTAYKEAYFLLHKNRPDKIDTFYKKISQFRDLIRESDIKKVKEEISSNANMKNSIKQCLKDFQKFCRDIELP